MNLTDQPVCPVCGWSREQNNESHQLPAGTVLRDQYEVGKVLGQGGFGITYLGYDRYLQQIVAIKEFYPGTQLYRDCAQSTQVQVLTAGSQAHYNASKERFLREARALARLKDVPEIVGIYSCFEENNTAYIVMEFIRGATLEQYVDIRGGKLSPDETLRILKPILSALDRVHKAGLVHRDISPDNIILHPTGGARLLDFGAVRAVENPDVDKAFLSHSTEAIVKQGFAPMEQYAGRGVIGPWTDEYALCATIYYCLTGKVPTDALARSLGEEEPDWESIPGLTGTQRAALEKGMSLRIKNRFRSVNELAEALFEAQPPAKEAEKPEPIREPEAPKPIPEQKEPEPEPEKPEPAPEQAEPEPEAPKPAPEPEKPKHEPEKSRPAPSERKPKRKLWLAAAAAALILVVGALWGTRDPKDTREALPEEPLASQIAATTEAEPTQTTQPTQAEPQPTEPRKTYVMAQAEDLSNLDYGAMTGNPFWGQTVYPRDAVRQILFQDSTEGAAADAWDVSEAQDGSILAWMDGGDLHVAADGIIALNPNASYLFSSFVYLERIEWDGCLDTSQVTNMDNLFSNCDSLTQLDLSCFDTSQVTSMKAMFNGCARLPQLDLSGFDTSRVTDTSWMFSFCDGLTELDVSGFDTSQVTDMSNMFYNCSSLTDLDLTGFDTSRVQYMQWMFGYCTGLTSLDLSSFDIGSVWYTTGMFIGCSSLTTLNLSGFDASNLWQTERMFQGCAMLEQLICTDTKILIESHNR